jgi:protein TonB
MPMPAPARTEALPAGARRALAFVIVVAHLGVWWALATSRPASPMASAGAPLEVMLISAPLSRPSIIPLPHPPSLALPAAPRIAEPAITFTAETTQALQRSSGFARLDEQALAAMRQARFAPCTEHGMPIECESSAALAYDLEN